MSESIQSVNNEDARASEVLSDSKALHEKTKNLAAQLNTVSRTSQDFPSEEAWTEMSGRVWEMMGRYRDSYLLARVAVALGSTIKVVGIVLAGVILVAAFFFGTLIADDVKNGGRVILVSIFIGIIISTIVGFVFYVAGVIVSASGQNLKATLDSAVNTSPFMDDQEKAQMMSLPTA